MIEALEHTGDLEPASIAAALRTGCYTLGLLIRDLRPGFPLYEEFKRLSTLRREHRREFDRHTQSLTDFTESFLFLEERALLQAGASPKLVHFLFKDVNATRDTHFPQVLSLRM